MQELARDEGVSCRFCPVLSLLQSLYGLSSEAMTAEAAACKAPASGESYEEYLERMRSDFDSQLMIYRQVRNACAWAQWLVD